MSRLSTANDLLVDVIQFLDSNHNVDDYKKEPGALRYKIDRYLNKKDFNYDHINEALEEIQSVTLLS